MQRLLKNLFLIILLACCVLSCDKPKVADSSPAVQTNSYAAVQARHFAAGQLEAHFRKHALQFGPISQEEYLQRAISLLNAPVDAKVLMKTRPNGDILRYKPSTGEFAVMTKTGRIRTYFKANEQYWGKQ